MNASLRLMERAVIGFNHLPLWRGECRVWEQRMAASTFERWLYLRMHRFGRMGRKERLNLSHYIRRDMTIVDVGANVGLYTVLLSRLVGPGGRVVAFEPEPELFAQLKRNCALNDCGNVEAHNLALGRRADRLVLHKMLVNSGDNHFGARGGGAFCRDIDAQVVALGEYAPNLKPNLVKIDVQGWELDVLLGMEPLLVASPETELYLEFWPEGFRRAGYGWEDIVKFLRKLGFALYLPGTTQPLDDDAMAALNARTAGRLKYTDLYAARRPPQS